MTLDSTVKKSNISHYELKRKQLIEENQKLLTELGLTPEPAIANRFSSEGESEKKRRRYKYIKAPSTAPTPTRLSRRLRGEIPEDITELEDLVDDNDRIRQQEMAQVKSEKTKYEEMLTSSIDSVSVPVTLRSIGTTIWSLGKLNTDTGRSKSWSSRGCRYKHPYPIGYEATKSHFGNDYTMKILAGEAGEPPLFTVQVGSTIFKGNTPTAPWTEACIKSKSSSTRVSGPLFYGFSDPLTMRLIEEMEGYEKTLLPEDAMEES
ncbi:hypothetical protein K501DRAFT_208490 [Backusella circina FSU 941]|nr:hypothetical protein K501DRAFT_208490 [Backusella circina FSU 941]